MVDTPGFSDSDNEDGNLIGEMIDVMKNGVKSVDGIVLLINGGALTRYFPLGRLI